MSSNQLDIVIRMARERRDEAAQRLAEVQGLVQSAQTQLEQLQSYQQQYMTQSAATAAQGTSVQALADARKFIGELDNLIHAQQQTVDARERDIEAVAESWSEATRYLQAVEKLKALRDAEADQRSIKREQQLVDDVFSLKHSATYGHPER